MAKRPIIEKVKVTIRLPKKLWQRTRLRAVREERDAQDIIVDGLKLYFERSPKQPPVAAGGS